MDSIPENLKSALKTNRLLPLIGAGVSMSITKLDGTSAFPNWKELLERARQALEAEIKNDDADLVRIFLGKNDYKSAAQHAYEGLKGNTWFKFIKEQLDIDFNTINTSSCELPKAIWGLSKQIITLNYDKVLEWACPNRENICLIDNNCSAELNAFQMGALTRPAVWHLHGHISNSAELVLTPNGYNNLYPLDENTATKYKAALQILQNSIASKTLLFIGCSLDDVDLLDELQKQQKLFSENVGPHYALVHENQKDEIRKKLSAKSINIQLISFSEYGDPLVSLIRKIGDVSELKLSFPPVSSHEVAPVLVTTEIMKVALLSANPINDEQESGDLYKELAKFPWQVDCYPFSLSSLRSLDSYKYIFIESRTIKDRIVVEDEFYCATSIPFSDIEDNIGNDLDSTMGIFIFVNALPDINRVHYKNFPVVISAASEKRDFNSFTFKIFKKGIKDFDGNSISFNYEKIQLRRPVGNYQTKLNSKITSLPQGIDTKVRHGFIGRKSDLEAISRGLVRVGNNGGVLTIKGAGGTGKTKISAKLIFALSQRGLYEEGMFFIDCEFIAGFADFHYKIATCFGLEQSKNIKESIKIDNDRSKKLIFLDNFEPLLHSQDKEYVLDLLSFICDYASILVTSRELIGVDGEVIYDLRQLTTDEALELFLKESGIKDVPESHVKLLREGIIEELLDNNPLAIKLITRNMPKGKDLGVLKLELENDFFRKITDLDLDVFDELADRNINRKRSLYSSILYSYQYLNEKEKEIFEVLSLFPDGINLEHFDRITSSTNSSGKSFIPDKIIRRLENSSLVESNNGSVRLQSIIGKFSTAKLKERSDIEWIYGRVFDYSFELIKALDKLRFENEKSAFNFFKKRSNNFITIINLFGKFNIDQYQLCKYVDAVAGFCISICSNQYFIKYMSSKIDIFEGDYKRAVKSTLLRSRYYDGDFEFAYKDLVADFPLDELCVIRYDNKINEIIISNALPLYSMEGYVIESVQSEIHDDFRYQVYNGDFLILGQLYEDYAISCDLSFWTIEALLIFKSITVGEVDEYLKLIFENEHIEKMQISYSRAKVQCINVDRIESLVEVNPYTSGLKGLMLAFLEENFHKARVLYEDSIRKLINIKYYYVEAIYLYSKFLLSNNSADFQVNVDVGLQLAKKHHYKYLQYQFEQLVVPSGKEYDVNDYPLPNDLTSKVRQKIISLKKENLMKNKFTISHFRSRR